MIVNKVRDILESALSGAAPSRDACEKLLTFSEHSMEAAQTRAVADHLSRQRYDNKAMLLGQIGVETAACPGNCRFCVFGKDHTTFPEVRMTREQLIERLHDFVRGGALYALFLMYMHEYDFSQLLETVSTVATELDGRCELVVNVGDFDLEQAWDLQAAGADGAYHVCRLREGEDTDLAPEARKQTIEVIRDAELKWYYCCEPVGPEHTPRELVDQMFLGVERGCFQHAAMRRVWLPDSPLADRGQISELRLAQIVAVVTLASLGSPETRNIAVHEPNLIGLTSGANVVYAECGINPRDTAEDTASGRGLDTEACRKMLYEAGFSALQHPRGKVRPLDYRPLAVFPGEAPSITTQTGTAG